MRTTTSSVRTHARRRRWTPIACAVLLVTLSVMGAHADGPAEAQTLLEQGRTDAAQQRLLRWLLEEGHDAQGLLEAARTAAALGDMDLLERIQGIGETWPDEGGPRLDLALGTAYLGIARARLARQDQGPTLAFLFADAEARAKRAFADPALRADALRLLADTRYAQGDLAGALAAVAEAPAGVADTPALEALVGRLTYERAVQTGLDAQGRPTEAGRAELASAQALLARAAAAETLSRAERQQASLVRAWAAHRLGDLETAEGAYLDAQALAASGDMALRGLESLFTGRAERLAEALASLAERLPRDAGVLDRLVFARRAAGDVEGALMALEQRLALDEQDPRAWILGGRLMTDLAQWREAEKHYARALELDPASQEAATGLEQVAVSLMGQDLERGLEVYEALLRLRPEDPYVRNNLGFLLREVVTPWTSFAEGQVQTLRPDAPPRIRELLVRCRDVYREAAALIPEAQDEERDVLTSWNLAGIVNDYGLIVHYFKDVQDAVAAEAAYLRALRMTDDAFKDTYAPNLQRLYGLVLPDRELVWYRIARRAKEAIQREEQDTAGRLLLLPDEAKRQAAAEDEARLRAALHEELAADAEADGAPWPPEGR